VTPSLIWHDLNVVQLEKVEEIELRNEEYWLN
jgi:hypothetical protein